MKISFSYLVLCVLVSTSLNSQGIRDHGIVTGVLKTGAHNSITDVGGVKVGHETITAGDINTGVTVILPHGGNIFQDKVPAGIFVGNGFGKLAGTTQVNELGNIETPIALTNTLSVGTGMKALINYTLSLSGNENVYSVNAVVGETNDGYLNNIREMFLTEEHFLSAIEAAGSGKVKQGNVGAGTATSCFGFKGGIGTSSRELPERNGGYTVGVLVQTNFGGVLSIDGVPVGERLGRHFMKGAYESADGSCMIVIATDAPLTSRNLKRLASRSMLGLARTGGVASNGSGDYAIAFSTAESVRVPYRSKGDKLKREELSNDDVSPLFLAVIEATEEAILNSLFSAQTLTGYKGRTIERIPMGKVLEIMKEHRALD